MSSNLSYMNENVDLKRSGFASNTLHVFCLLWWSGHLTAKAVEGTALTFEGVDNVHGGDCFAFGMFGVGDSISNDILEEHLEDTSCLLIDESRDSLDSSSTCKTSDGRLGDSLDIISEDLPVPFGASLSETLTALTTSSHDALMLQEKMMPR